MNLNYKALPTLAKVHSSDAFYRGVMGPVRSGKSTGCSMEVMKWALIQNPQGDGVRRSRFAVVRNTYGELRDTTLKTWLMWFPEEHFGKFNRQQMTHYVEIEPAEGVRVSSEVLFRALDRPDDVAKLLSMELTGAWVNEAREVPKIIVDTLGDRVGQYPSALMGGCVRPGVIMDTNPPDSDHWWYTIAETGQFKGQAVDPDVWEFFKQPGALLEGKEGYSPNPLAENIENLNEGMDYYLKRLSGKGKDYIKVYYCGQYGFVIDGKPVFPEYIDAEHCTKDNLEPIKGLPIYVGLDFGLTPAAVFTQRFLNGSWRWFDELCAEDMGISRFADILGPVLRGRYSDFDIAIYGDPAGEQRSQTDERTPFQILEAKGIPALPAPTNDFTLRREAVAVHLQRFIDGRPGLMVSPKCVMARKGLAGGFAYKRKKVSGDETYHDMPYKNMYSHPVEAGGYAMIGAGEGDLLIKNPHSPIIRYPGSTQLRDFSINQGQGWMAG